MEHVVVAKGLTKRFGSFVAVDHIDLEIRRGEIFGLLGPNGAGKTTTIRMICGLLEPSEGELYVLGRRMPEERRRVLEKIGYMPQGFSLYEDLTVYENLKFYAALYGIKGQRQRERIEELLEEFLLKDVKDRLAGKLSGGMKRRLALAVALIHEPEFLIVDEPTAGVDPPLRRMFWEYFRKLRKEGVTLLVTTHYMDEAEHCDRLALMSRGRLLAIGSPEDIKRQAFGGDLVEVRLRGPVPLVAEASRQIKKLAEDGFVRFVDDEQRKDETRIVLTVRDAEEAIPVLIELLDELGLRFYVSRLPVSLEDAFIRLLGGVPSCGSSR